MSIDATQDHLSNTRSAIRCSMAHLDELAASVARTQEAIRRSHDLIAAQISHQAEPPVAGGPKPEHNTRDHEASQRIVAQVMDLLRDAGYEFEFIDVALH